jgi:transposase InsO family protein
VWGLDIVGPLRKAPGGFTHLLVVIDKFSKWVEVRPITSLRAEQAVTFFTNIIHRFGVPNSIITDNGSQFTGRKFLEFCNKFHIRVDWAAVAHPKATPRQPRTHKLSPPWEGPYVVVKVLKPGTYKLANEDGEELTNAWNIQQLHRFYP